ncbi:MAG: prolyl oligopeptidase family serine peptidase [Hyphomonadaceae bacterium]
MRKPLLGFAVALLAAACASPQPLEQAAEDFWHCPPGYDVKEGLNTDFPSDGLMRAFVVIPAKNTTSASPAWVPLSGTVESANMNLNIPRSGANALMANEGVTVIGPVRQCANQDPNIGFKECDGVGSNGWNWKPWNDGRAANAEGEKWKNDAGPDSRFFEAMVRCVGTKFPLDAKRLFIGGISAGGTATNRALTFNSDFWAGGMPISGEWYVSNDDGSALSFNDARAAVAENPTKVFQGRVGPYPLHASLGSLVVITVWGGEKDMWDCGPPLGLCSDYRPTTQASSNYFSSMPNVVHVACSSTHGHMWPQINTQAFNAWALKTMASHPKGSDPKQFELTPPPEGYSCKLGPFTDHY